MNIAENEDDAGDEPRMSKELCEGEKRRDFECRSPSTTEDTLAEEYEEAETSINAVPPQATPADIIPDGGLVAWLQVLGSFFLFINCWGIVNAFGAFQYFYEGNLLSSSTPSNISWIGSIQAFLLLLVGSATGPLFDAGHFRKLICAGSFLLVFGTMMLSISHSYYQVMLAQGICMGLGCGLIFVPSIAILPTYFSTRRAIALGIAASGSSLGGIIYPIVFHKLEPRIGFGWATRVLGFIMIGTLSFSLCIMKVRVLPPQKRRLIQLAAWKEPPYTLFALACFFGFMGFYFPFYYVSTYAVESGITSPDTAFYFLAILNAASSFGRVLPNALADKIGPLNVAVPMVTVTAGLTFALIGIKTTAGLIVFCILYGFFSGSFVSIPPAAIASLSSDVRMIGTRMGMSFAFSGIGLLIGNPIAGQIVKRKGFESAIGFVGAVIALAAIFDMAARTAKVGLKIKVIA